MKRILGTKYVLRLRKLKQQKVRQFSLYISDVLSGNVSLAQLQELFVLIQTKQHSIPYRRIGSMWDGGYVVPDDLDGIVACFSPGVANNADFELFFSNLGIQCYLSDYSVPRAPIDNEYVNFTKKFIGANSNEKFITLQSWISSHQMPPGDLILQMDIEGYEWEVLLSTTQELLSIFRIIVIELHNFQEITRVSSYSGMFKAIKNLTANHYVIVTHPNNNEFPIKFKGISIPPVVELTLIRKDRVSELNQIASSPDPYLANNNPKLPPINFDVQEILATMKNY
jgi:hypothetical protein